MIGRGRDRQTSQVTWYVDTDPATWVWQTTDFAERDTTADGYNWDSGTTKRWGENTLESGTTTYNVGTGTTQALATDFDNITGESQGAVGDSGGGVFYLNGSTWELAGIMGATGTFNGQPGETAVFGNLTYLIDLSYYRSSVIAVIPEPAHLALAWAGLTGLLVFRFRTRGQ
jgi:hypothetical protein